MESFEQKMKKIIEGVFRPLDEILKNFFDAEQYSLLSNDEWELIYILAIENFGVIDWMSFSSLEHPTGFMDDFLKYLQKHQPLSFKDVLFAFSVYSRNTPWRQKEDPIEKLNNDKQLKGMLPGYAGMVIEYLLGETYGFLLWEYQLHKILRIFLDGQKYSREALDKIRKDINRKHPEVYKFLKSLIIDQGYTFANLIEDRSIDGVVSFSDHYYNGAFKLYKFLNSYGD
ncbi:MAG: hypothetical protein HYW01_04430 [Deltaproteobacteria bacterium]|nr:hypothetical protein [Deltaproteobacteria bacterium]